MSLSRITGQFHYHVMFMLATLSTITCLTISQQPTTMPSENTDYIGQLEGEAGYRMASLLWKFPIQEKPPSAFRVRYCERHDWGLHRCRYQTVDNAGNSSHRTARKEDSSENSVGRNDVYKIDIGGLRMATNYSFEIMLQEVDNTIEHAPAQISLQTKGFSAKAKTCLADSSIVVVETGPFFGGRISVENAQSPSCFLKGDPQSSETKYTLRIRHEECGSTVNGSKVTTVILVQENLPILTHSTRKFIVVCSFSPESFIVKAGVNLPRGASFGKSIDNSRLIRIAAQNSNLLVADKENRLPNIDKGNIQNELPQQQQHRPLAEHLQDSQLGADNETEDGIRTSATTNLQNRPRQSRAYKNLSHDKSPLSLVESDSRNKGKDGAVEGYLVFGMICIVIVSGLASILWFIKSSYGNAVGVQQDDNSSENGDNGSELSSICNSFQIQREETSLETVDSSQPNSISISDRVPHNLDTRSELEVELDFEFSEEIHTPTSCKRFTLELDETQQLSSVSQA